MTRLHSCDVASRVPLLDIPRSPMSQTNQWAHLRCVVAVLSLAYGCSIYPLRSGFGVFTNPVQSRRVATIVAGKYLNLADLLSDNSARPDDHEPQLFFDCRLALPAPRRVNKRQIMDLVVSIQAFSIYSLILTSYFPHRWRDLTSYKLLIIRTYRQFAGRAWLNYDKAFREHVAAARVTDWSSLNVQLYNFHTAGSQVRAPGPPQSSDEPTGFSSSMIVCKSWNQAGRVAPSSQCRFKHVCDRCNGDHRARECADISQPASLKSPEQSKRRK